MLVIAHNLSHEVSILVMYQTLFAAFLGIAFSEARDFCFVCVLGSISLSEQSLNFSFISKIQAMCRALLSPLKVLTYTHSYSSNHLP